MHRHRKNHQLSSITKNKDALCPFPSLRPILLVAIPWHRYLAWEIYGSKIMNLRDTLQNQRHVKSVIATLSYT